MDINKKLKQKHKRRDIEKKAKTIIRKLLTPIIELDAYISKKEDNKRELLRELGRNMNMDEAVKISIKLIVDNLIKREKDIYLVVAEYADSDYDVYTASKWLLKNISINNRNKEYEKLRYYLYKHEAYNKEALDFNRGFTQAIYDKTVCYKGLKVEWVIDKEKYGYFKSRNYEKTLVIGLEDR